MNAAKPMIRMNHEMTTRIQTLEIEGLTENSTFNKITRCLEDKLANEPPTREELDENMTIIARVVENQPVTSEFEQSDEQRENDELINESQEITLEPVRMDEQHDSSDVPDEPFCKKMISNTENQEMEPPTDKPNSLSRELDIAENPHQPEEQKTSEILFSETGDTRIESRPSVSETIDSLETLNEKLEQHHDLKQIEDFAEHYRRATVYFQLKDLQQQYESKSIPYKTLQELSQETGIHTWTLRRWERNDTQPWLLHRITQRELS